MLPSDILELVRKQPFRPFRIVMNSGRTYDVMHPGCVKVGIDWVTYFEFSNPEEEIYERFHLIGLQLIEHTEFLKSPNKKRKA